MQKITIRRARIDELPLLLEFEQSLINSERPFDDTFIPERFHYYDIALMIEQPDAEVLVAEIDDEVIGSGHARIKDAKHYDQTGQFAYLGFMYVKPEHRGKGINRMIIEALINWAKGKGLTEARLQVYDENVSAVKAYEKVGFKKQLVVMRRSL